MDIIEKSHITPTAIVEICGTPLNMERNTHTLDRKKAVGRKVSSSFPIDIVFVITDMPIIPKTAKAVIATKSNRNLRTTQRKSDFPCAEITSNI